MKKVLSIASVLVALFLNVSAQKKNLDKVVAVRGTLNALMALTSDGEIYTWGIRTHLGDNTGRLARPYATLMVKPTGITPKMIGMTQSSLTNVTYYLLGTNGQLYSLGDNYLLIVHSNVNLLPALLYGKNLLLIVCLRKYQEQRLLFAPVVHKQNETEQKIKLKF